jgi:hypothetical protein
MTDRRIYVTQFDTSWSLTSAAWLRACELNVAGEEFTWDDLGQRLSRRRSKWDKQFRPLDWDDEDWTYALTEAKGETP